MMNKRLRLAGAALLAAAVAGLAWLLVPTGTTEPFVDGRPLSSWLDYYVHRQSEAQHEKADQVLDQVGTNAIPTLLWMLRQKDSDTKRKIMELLQKQPFIKFHYIPAERRNGAAYFAFLRLGARAEAAVPGLIEIYQQKISPASRRSATLSLGVIGPVAKRAIPLLIRDLGDTNVPVRCDILLALGHFRAEPQLVVPALANALRDSDASVRLFACTALWSMGIPKAAGVRDSSAPSLKETVPALVHLLSDSDARVRAAAASALQQIDPAAIPQEGAP
jgi:HEAT repeat protein